MRPYGRRLAVNGAIKANAFANVLGLRNIADQSFGRHSICPRHLKVSVFHGLERFFYQLLQSSASLSGDILVEAARLKPCFSVSGVFLI
jgi:hypothetical protein